MRVKYPVTVHSKIRKETKDNLDKVSKAKDITLSECIRMILEDYLK